MFSSVKYRPFFESQLYLFLFVLIGGAVWIWFTRAPSGSTTSGSLPAPQRGFQAPDFELFDRSDRSYKLSDLRGRPLLLNFWASWCSPCKAEMPAMEDAYQRYKDRGFLVLAVNTTYQDNREEAMSFADGLGLNFPIVFDEDSLVSSQYKLSALPSTFFINGRGIITEVVIGGPMSEALLDIRIQSLFSMAE